MAPSALSIVRRPARRRARSEIRVGTARAAARCRPCRSRRRQQRLVAWRWARRQFTSIRAAADIALAALDTARDFHTAPLAPVASAAPQRRSWDGPVAARSEARNTRAAARAPYPSDRRTYGRRPLR